MFWHPSGDRPRPLVISARGSNRGMVRRSAKPEIPWYYDPKPRVHPPPKTRHFWIVKKRTTITWSRIQISAQPPGIRTYVTPWRVFFVTPPLLTPHVRLLTRKGGVQHESHCSLLGNKNTVQSLGKKMRSNLDKFWPIFFPFPVLEPFFAFVIKSNTTVANF